MVIEKSSKLLKKISERPKRVWTWNKFSQFR